MRKSFWLLVLFILLINFSLSARSLKYLAANCFGGSPIFTINYESETTAVLTLYEGHAYVLVRVEKKDAQTDILHYLDVVDCGRPCFNWKNHLIDDSPVMIVKRLSEKKYIVDKEKYFEDLPHFDSDFIDSESSNKELCDGVGFVYKCDFDLDEEIDFKGKKKKYMFGTASISHNGQLEFFLYKDGYQKAIAFTNKRRTVTELSTEFSIETRIYNARVYLTKNTYLGVFKTIDSEWMAHYCWNINKNKLYFKARKIGSDKNIYSKNLKAKGPCSEYIRYINKDE